MSIGESVFVYKIKAVDTGGSELTSGEFVFVVNINDVDAGGVGNGMGLGGGLGMSLRTYSLLHIFSFCAFHVSFCFPILITVASSLRHGGMMPS